jgi:hypothetical protein
MLHAFRVPGFLLWIFVLLLRSTSSYAQSKFTNLESSLYYLANPDSPSLSISSFSPSFFSESNHTYATDDTEEEAEEVDPFAAVPHFIPLANYPEFEIARNNPGDGLCGYAALSALVYGDYQSLETLRALMLERWTTILADEAQLNAFAQTVTAGPGNDEDYGIAEESLIDILALQETLLAPAGQPSDDGEGFAADLTVVGLWLAGIVLDARIRVYTVHHTQTQPVVLQDINPNGQHAYHLFLRFGHYQAMRPNANPVIPDSTIAASNTPAPPEVPIVESSTIESDDELEEEAKWVNSQL